MDCWLILAAAQRMALCWVPQAVPVGLLVLHSEPQLYADMTWCWTPTDVVSGCPLGVHKPPVTNIVHMYVHLLQFASCRYY